MQQSTCGRPLSHTGVQSREQGALTPRPGSVGQAVPVVWNGAEPSQKKGPLFTYNILFKNDCI